MSGRIVADAAAVAASLVALTLCVTAVRRGAPRQSWTLLAGACALWAAGEVVRLVSTMSGDEVAFPSLVDAVWLAAAPLATLAALVLPGGPASVTVRVRTFLDGCLVIASVLFAGWATVLGSLWDARKDDPLALAVGLAYGMAAVALAAIAVVTIAHVRRAGGRPLVLTAGLIAMAVVDVAHTGWRLHSVDGSTIAIEPVRVLAYLLVALAAARATRPAGSGAATPTAPAKRRDALILLPYVPLVADAAVAASRIVAGEPFGPFLATTGAVIVGLVLVRQLVALVDHVQLTARLEATVVALNEREAQLRHLAFHDTLTGLANRALFWDRVGHAVDLGDHRTAQVAVLYVDLDGFKAVNDHFGHPAGDELLAGVAQRLSSCVRARDTVSRFGGDEFAILLEAPGDHGTARTVARRILDVLREPFVLDGGIEVTIGASIGIAIGDAGRADAEALVQTADDAMYEAKAGGRGRYVHAVAERRELTLPGGR